MKSSLYYIIFCIILISCERETIDKELVGPKYLPLELGKYIEYERTNINHDAFLSISDTTIYLQRETITEVRQDSNGIFTYIGILENSYDSGASWQFQHYILFSKDSYQVQRVELDVRKVVLSFPLLERKSWDVNAFNTIDFKRARVRDLAMNYSLDDTTFTNTVIIDLGMDEDQFFTNIEYEVYAKNIGLVKHYFQDLERQPDKYLQGTEYVKTFKETNW